MKKHTEIPITALRRWMRDISNAIICVYLLLEAFYWSATQDSRRLHVSVVGATRTLSRRLFPHWECVNAEPEPAATS